MIVGKIEVDKKVSDTHGIHSFIAEHDKEEEFGCLIAAVTQVITETMAGWMADAGVSPLLLDGETTVIKLNFEVTEQELNTEEEDDDDDD